MAAEVGIYWLPTTAGHWAQNGPMICSPRRDALCALKPLIPRALYSLIALCCC